MQLPKDVDLLLSEKRSRKLRARLARLWKEKKKKALAQSHLDKAFGARSVIIKMIADSFDQDAPKIRNRLKLSIPDTFSIIERPEAAIATIGSLAKTIRHYRLRSVILDHSKLKHYDLAANGLLDIVAVELKTETRRSRRQVKWQGLYPTDPAVKQFIRALGIVKHLGLEHEYAKPDEATDLRVFDERTRHYHQRDPDKADPKTRIVGRFSDHIDSCLRDHGRALTLAARHKLCEYTGEILDNAEEHARMVDWTIQGYLDNSLDDPICEIAIFNLGETIAQSLGSVPKDSYTWKQISPYIDMHKGRSWFGPNWTEDNLLTLIALQGHVSSKNHSATDTRGNGTVDLIEFFQKVHSECGADSPIKATMAIVSGGTYIYFDGTYKMTETDTGSKVISFNAENDLYKKPDAT